MGEEREVAQVHYSRWDAETVAKAWHTGDHHRMAVTVVALYDRLADRDATIDSLRAEVERLTLLMGAKHTEVDVIWLEEVESLRAELEEARGLLRRLLDLKDGPRDSPYYVEKPKAWEAARAFLSKPAPEPQEGGAT